MTPLRTPDTAPGTTVHTRGSLLDVTNKVGRAQATREAILTVAERMFAEHGVIAVSNRQVSEAAGQGNNTAVGYHFGTKADLVRAIVRRHAAPIEELRREMVTRTGDAPTCGTGWRAWCGRSPTTSRPSAARRGSPASARRS